MEEVWVATDIETNRLVAFGEHSSVARAANVHEMLSGNRCKIRTLKRGMTVTE